MVEETNTRNKHNKKTFKKPLNANIIEGALNK